jgi:phosphatidylinositol-3-phosphatase
VRPRLLIALTVAASAALVGPMPTASGAAPTASIRHVFIIMDENESSTSTFGDPAADPYLAKTLPSEGAYLPNYYAVGHESNDNYIAIASGQPPNLLNQTDCINYINFVGTAVPGGVDEGVGCVFPTATQTIGNQLSSEGYTWKAYEQDMGNDPSRESAACGHPAVGSLDQTQDAVYGDGYATRHDPFPYFHAVIDNRAYCDAHVVALGAPSGLMPSAAVSGETGLADDLKSVATTPNYSFITPNLCMDGHDYPCKNEPSGSSALNDIDRFLQTWVPMITSSPAFKDNGLLIITFDEGADSDSTSCCGESPNITSPLPGLGGSGGGKIGAIVLSPYTKPGTVSKVDYNHYSTLASIENIFGLPKLGEAANVTSTFGLDVFNNLYKTCTANSPAPWERC